MSGEHVPTVLIVEDEALIALELEDIAKVTGWSPLVAFTYTAALALLEHTAIDFALIDGTAGRIEEFAFARTLFARGIRFAFCTGLSAAMFPDDFKTAPVLMKPYRAGDIVEVLRAALP